MGRYLDLAREVAEKAPATCYDINDQNDQSPAQHRISMPLEPGLDKASFQKPSAQCTPQAHQADFQPIPEPGPGATVQAWIDWYEERCAIREFEGGYTRLISEALTFGEAINRWHLLHGKRPDPAYCAGCGELLSGGETLPLPDGGRVHIDDEWICLRSYGKQWRSEAVKALAEIGITPPSASAL